MRYPSFYLLFVSFCVPQVHKKLCGASVSVNSEEQTCTENDETCVASGTKLKEQPNESYYTHQDDVSWAITHDELRHEFHQKLYDDFLKGCRNASRTCAGGERLRLYMNNHQPASMINYTETGIAKIKTPPELWKILNDFYQKNKGEEVIEWGHTINPYHNLWEVHTEIMRLDNETLGGGALLHGQISQTVRPILEEWTGQRLAPVSVYGIRLYKNNSILAPHVDRSPLISSCIINIDQEVDDPWPLEVFTHDGRAHNITMEPGDMVLYESHSVIHGRPFPFKGNFYANTFLHFEPVGPLGDLSEVKLGPNENGVPPYFIPGSVFEGEWKRDNPKGWKFLEIDDALDLAATGDIRTLEMLAQVKPDLLTAKDANGWSPLHEAIHHGRLNIVKFLLEHGATPDDKTGSPGETPKAAQYTPIELAVEFLGNDHEVTQFLYTVAKL